MYAEVPVTLTLLVEADGHHCSITTTISNMTSSILQLAVFCSLALGAFGLGINCRGSSGCKGEPTLDQLNGVVQTLDDNRSYRSGEHIVCLPRGRGIISLVNWNDGLCIFLQYAPDGTTITGSRVKQLIPQLMAHGCKGCGSIPIEFPGSNDPAPGILTVNYVSDTNNPCNGVC